MTIEEAFAFAVQHHQAGRLAEAATLCREILAVESQHARAVYLLGLIALQEGRWAAAVELLGRAGALLPLDPGVFSHLGGACLQAGRLEEAIAALRRAVQLDPRLATAHYNLGNALRDCGQWEESIAAYRRAIELEPGKAIAHGNLGNVLQGQGRFEEAIAAYRRALEMQPGLLTAQYSLGVVLLKQGRLREAIASFQRTLQLQPEFGEAYAGLGQACFAQGRIHEAIAAYRRAVELPPHAADEPKNRVIAHSNLLLCLQYAGGVTAEEIFREHLRWDELQSRALGGSMEPPANDPSPTRRLRVGYISPDFRFHSVAFFLESLLAGHDRGAVEIFCYADLPVADEVTARMRAHAGHWREIAGWSDEAVAALLRRDRIDILVDLAGHTAGHRLRVFARRPAPVQVTWLGYCDTTGMRVMDYRLTDAYADPPGASEHLHTEQLVRLPETFACFRPAEIAPPVGPLPALSCGRVTFASFHTLPKLNEPLLERWAQILRRVPASRLLLVVADAEEGGGGERLRAFFAQRGIPAERLEFQRSRPLAEYLALHHEVDLLLDSDPFGGHTVSCHALWMGVPVVTLAGSRHASRMVASVLQNVGLPELIAHTPAEYVELAVALAEDLPRLAALRAGLRERMAASPLVDGPRFAKNVEAAYRQMWRTWCNHRAAFPTT